MNVYTFLLHALLDYFKGMNKHIHLVLLMKVNFLRKIKTSRKTECRKFNLLKTQFKLKDVWYKHILLRKKNMELVIPKLEIIFFWRFKEKG